jgi:hypothetical protein
MGLYPKNIKLGQTTQTGVKRLAVDALSTVKYTVTPDAEGRDAIHAAVTLGVAAQTITTAITNPDVPRTLSVTGVAAGDPAAGGAGAVLITGTDIADEVITETITAVAGQTVAGTKAFKTVASILFPIGTGTISVSVTDVLGLPACLPFNTVLYAYLNEAREGTAPTVTVSSTVVALNTVDLNSALDGSAVDVVFLV